MKKYTVLLASRVEAQLLRHTKFLSRVSISAAKRFRTEFHEILDRLKENPYQFSEDTDLNLPEGMYRKALFAKWYKALFSVEGDIVYLDTVADCRQEINSQ